MNIGDLPPAIFSPAKVVYVSFVILIGLKILPAPSTALFLFVSLIFLLVEVFHNDYLRIRLNDWAGRRNDNKKG